MTREVPISGTEYVALVDDSDYADVAQYKWFANRNRKQVYPRRYVRVAPGVRTTIHLHTQLMGEPPASGMMVDHINGDGLDNRRANLRFVTPQQNGMNRRDKRGSSQYRGVRAVNGRWEAVLSHGGKRTNLGRFSDEKDAALAWDRAASEAYGEYAALNFADAGEGEA